MPAPLDRRSLLLASEDQDRWAVRALLESPPFAAWEVREADSVERARFVLQMDPCDVVLLDAGLYRGGDPSAVAWLAAHGPVPVLLLAEPDAGAVVSALENGARHWLPRDVALRHPEVLAATLNQVARVGELERRARAAGDSLAECRRQVGRLVSLLWEAAPGDGGRSWFPQRHMLERLEEEVARCKRHGEALTVVLGEVRPEGGGRLAPDEEHRVARWAAGRLSDGKRRCDVAGQYGPNGFLLLLPNTTREGAEHCCRRIRVWLEEPAATAAGPLPPRHVSFGVVALSPEASTVKGLLSRAEERLEREKAGLEVAAGV